MTRHSSSRRFRNRDESGATLLLALVFLIIGSFVVVALVSESGTNLIDTNSLVSSRSQEYAADAGMDAAIQQSRYHNGPCQNYPNTNTSLQLSSGVYVLVLCSGTPLTNLSVAAAGTNVDMTAPVGEYFVPADVGQPVFGTNIPLNATVASYVNSTKVKVSSATGASANAGVGTGGQRLVGLWACVKSVSFASASCSPSSALLSASVLYTDTDSNGADVLGDNATVLSWVVSTSNS